jgi:hypothetical protein
MELRSILLIAVIVLASGCHPKPKHVAPAAPQPAPTAADVTVTKGGLPSGWPDFLPAYTGAAIVEGTRSISNNQPVLTVTLTTPDAPEKVQQFYGERANARQFTVASSSETPGEKLTLYRRREQSLSVSTHRNDQAALTNIELTLVGTYEEGASEASPTPPDTPPANSDANSGNKKDEPKSAVRNPLLPIYPGASGGEPKVSGPVVTARMSTGDSIEQVVSYYEQFYAGQGFASGGRTDIGEQVAESFSGPGGRISLNVRKGSGGTSINLSLQAAQ